MIKKTLEEVIEKHAIEPMTGIQLIDFNKNALANAIRKWIAENEENDISLCPNCHCMTKNVCGKCKAIKEVFR